VRPAPADEDTLPRLLRALASVGVYDEQDGGRYALTPLGEGLRSDVPASVRPLARTLTDPAVWSAWAHLGHSVRTVDNAFEALHGVDVWTHRQREPEHNAIFNDNMTSLSSLVADAVSRAHDFARLSSVVDVGGGQGILLEAVLAHEVGAAFSDLNMLVLPGGRERSEREYVALFDAAGLQQSRVIHTDRRMSILEAGAARP
jgi:hypothetical protein